MKLDNWLTVLGLLLLALLANTHEQRPSTALLADGTLPPGHAAHMRTAVTTVPQQPSITHTSVPLGLSMDLVKGL